MPEIRAMSGRSGDASAALTSGAILLVIFSQVGSQPRV
jgi:hypothetical protein